MDELPVTKIRANCKQCGQVLKGRPDKLFCDDICRGMFGNERRKREAKDVREAISMIKLIMKTNPGFKIVITTEFIKHKS